jgi:TusA-related sulfurtransferase
MKSDKPDRVLDCLGLFCPEPVFRTRIALDEMEIGEVLEIKSDDPASEKEIEHLISRLGHKILKIETDGEELRILIRKEK